MKEPYWFKRAQNLSQQHQYHSQIKITAKKSPRKQKNQGNYHDESFKNQIKSAGNKLLQLAYELQQKKQINEMAIRKTGDIAVNQVRCYQHNSSIIIYCSNEGRLLCSACAFNDDFHKRHNMIQAAKAQGILVADLKQIQKKLKITSGQISRERSQWQSNLQQLEKSYQKTQINLDKEFQKITATLSEAYRKSKEKLDQIFNSNRQSMQILVKSYTGLIKCLRYQHPYARVRHLYLQQISQMNQQLIQQLPSRHIGKQIIGMIIKYTKTVLTNFKNHAL